MNWTEADLKVFDERKLKAQSLEAQLATIEKGVLPTKVEEPCTPGAGIFQIDEHDSDRLAEIYLSEMAALEIMRFVPASGAASRMFKHLFDPSVNPKLYQAFFEQIEDFPFFEKLNAVVEKRTGQTVPALIADDRHDEVVSYLLTKKGLNYAAQPKGSILFHRYATGARTAFQEHFAEAVHYAIGRGGGNIHFTVPADFSEADKEALANQANERANDAGVKLHLRFSVQYPQTDTLSLNGAGEALRDAEGRLVFRPGGHGALIRNLDALDADLIFVKNIDNVVPESKMAPTVRSKKALAGLALMLHSQRSRLVRRLLSDEAKASDDAVHFLKEWFMHPSDELKAERETLLKLLDRPLRICGMVRNEGEPGGGPFWVRNRHGFLSAQIVERSQIDEEDDEQAMKLQKATHFNPVDLVCVTRKPDGGSYALDEFIHHEQAFITEKSYEGQTIRCLEHPGLWNGSMEDWLTVFVEVPSETFAPVKTVNDLLRPAHQSQ